MAILTRLSSWFRDPPPPPPGSAAAPDRDDLVDPVLAFDQLRAALAPARRALLAHPLYAAVDTLPRLRMFMAAHVFAVWDAMCLAKRLQRDLTSMTPLWRPPQAPELARLVNGVVLGEESDDGVDGEAISHCELYLSAMEEVGAPTHPFRRFLDLIGDGVEVDVALAAAGAPRPARAFVRRTLEIALEGDTVEVLAAFLFGRADVVPAMFRRLLPRWRDAAEVRRFRYYVERHVDPGGDAQGPAARRALIELIGGDGAAWRTARRVAEDALAARRTLWDRVHAELD